MNAMEHTDTLLGAYGFDGDATGYRQRLSGWLGNAADGDAFNPAPALWAVNAAIRHRGCFRSTQRWRRGGVPPHCGTAMWLKRHEILAKTVLSSAARPLPRRLTAEFALSSPLFAVL